MLHPLASRLAEQRTQDWWHSQPGARASLDQARSRFVGQKPLHRDLVNRTFNSEPPKSGLRGVAENSEPLNLKLIADVRNAIEDLTPTVSNYVGQSRDLAERLWNEHMQRMADTGAWAAQWRAS